MLDAALLPKQLSVAGFEELQSRLAGATRTWRSPKGRRPSPPSPAGAIPAHGALSEGRVLVSLEIDTSNTTEVRQRRRDVDGDRGADRSRRRLQHRALQRGPPIASEQQPRIFERFYRADASRHGSASSSGLGLAIVRSIMELHGGRAEVRSAQGQRTTFILHCPPRNAMAHKRD